MSVPQNLRHGKEELDVIIKARELASYTSKICANKKQFKEENDYHGITLDNVINTALKIYLNLYTANEIYVGTNHELAVHRLFLQKEAISLCNTLLALVSLSKTQFHLTMKRLLYWSSAIIEVREKAKGWYESDTKRYGKI